MNSFLLVFYIVILILTILNFLFHLLILRKRKKSIGEIQAKWSSIFNPSLPINRLILVTLFAYFLWCVYQVATVPKSSVGYHRLMFLAILLSFTPRWNVYTGSEGIVLSMKFIRWKYVTRKEIIIKGKRRYLEIEGPLSSNFSEMKTKRIPLPKHVQIS